jgi:hypothetical protein
MQHLKIMVMFKLVMMLSACGGTGQGEGQADALSAANLRGVALDGYLAGAECYLDVNNNYQPDAIEPSATTDSDGYYSYNPLTNSDYCAASASTEDAAHCLRTYATGSQIPVRCQNGYDVVSEEPFQGTLSALVDVTAGAVVEGGVISPLTSLFANADSDAKRAQLLTALGLGSEAEAAVDYLDTKNTYLVGLALKIQKIAEVIAQPIKTAHTNLSTDEPSVDPVGQVYAALTDFIIENQEANIDEVLTDADKLQTILTSAENKFKTAQTANTGDTFTSSVASDALAQSAARAAQVYEVIDDLCDTGNSTLTLAEINGCSRATEVVTQKVLAELDNVTVQTDSSIDVAVTCFTSTGCDAVVDALKNDNFDIGSLKNNDFSDATAAATQASLPGDAAVFADMGNKSLLVNDPDNSISNKQKNARLELYFVAGNSEAKGSLSACVRYIEGAAAASPTTANDIGLSSGNTLGSHITGNWEIIGSGYSMLVKLKIAEKSEPYRAILKNAGTNEDNQKIYRFDFDGGLENWMSVDGLVATPSTLPASNAECKTRFNSVSE